MLNLKVFIEVDVVLLRTVAQTRLITDKYDVYIAIVFFTL